MIKLERAGKLKEVYATFLQLYSSFGDKKLSSIDIALLNSIYWNGGGELTTACRRQMMESLNMSYGSVGNYAKRLRDKGLLVNMPGKKYEQIHPSINIALPVDSKEITFQLTIHF